MPASGEKALPAITGWLGHSEAVPQIRDVLLGLRLRLRTSHPCHQPSKTTLEQRLIVRFVLKPFLPGVAHRSAEGETDAGQR